ncbi:MAG: sugar ABC transporter permease [Bacilli bacterium]|nr:sugar ABC transporter permease [Bacilli bacterium]
MPKLYAETNLQYKSSKLSRKNKRLIFYILMLALPLIQFCIFYIYVNFNSIAMAFMSYKNMKGDGATFVGFKNFLTVFDIIKEKPHLLTNSLILAFFMLGVAMPLAILFSYYIYKKRFLHGFYRVVLFLPQIVSGVVFAIIVGLIFGAIALKTESNTINAFDGQSLASPGYTRTMLIMFTVWMSFGVNVLLFTGAMNNINPSLVEAAELDGCNTIHELIHVTIPAIFPTIVSFVIITVSGIFVNQMFLMDFNTIRSDQYTIGYFMYYQAQNANNGLATTKGNLNNGIYSYPVLSALSIMITVVLLPLTLGIKKLLNKFGPSTR